MANAQIRVHAAVPENAQNEVPTFPGLWFPAHNLLLLTIVLTLSRRRRRESSSKVAMPIARFRQ